MSDFGLKIGVDGEKEFKTALKDINRSFKVLGSEMMLVTAQFDKNDKSVQALTARNEVLNKGIDVQNTKIGTLQEALKNASESFGENDKRTQEWQVQLNRAQAELIGMERELKQNEKTLDETSDEMNEAEKQTDEFGDELAETSKKADDAEGRFSKLKGTMSAVGKAAGVAFVAVGAAAVAAAKALTDMTVAAAQYADEMLTMSTVTGMSTEALQAYKYAAELVDVPLETLTGSMAKQVRAMDMARQGGKQQVAAYQALGVAVMDANGNLRDSETVYWEVIDALGKVDDETERNAISMRIFGKSAQELNPLIVQGSAGIATLTEEAHKMGAVMSGDALKRLGDFDDSVQRLTSGAGAAKNALGLVLLPQLQILAGDGVNLIGEFTKGLNEAGGDWEKVRDVVSNTINDMVDVVMKVLPDFIQLGLDIVVSLIDGIIEALPQLTAGAVKLWTELVGHFITGLPLIVSAASEMIMALVEGLIIAVPKLIPAIVTAIKTIVETLMTAIPDILSAGIALLETLAQAVLEAIPEIINALPGVIKGITNFFRQSIPQIIEAGVALITSLVDALPDIIAQITEAMPQIVTSIVDTLHTLIPQLIDAGIRLFVSLVEALPEIIVAIVDAIPKIIDAVIKAVLESIPLLIDAGVKLLIALVENLPLIITTIVRAIPQIIQGLLTALTNNIPLIVSAGFSLITALVRDLPRIIVTIVKAIPQIITEIVSAISDSAWRIVEAGGNLISGLWRGIADKGAWLRRQISGFFGGVVDSIKNFFGISSPSMLFAGIGGDLAAGIGIGFEKVMARVSDDMRGVIPTSFTTPIYQAAANPAAPTVYHGPLFTVQNMTVRSDADIENISRQLHRNIQAGVRARGGR